MRTAGRHLGSVVALVAGAILAGMAGAAAPDAEEMTKDDWNANEVLYEYELCIAYHPALGKTLGDAYQAWRTKHESSVKKLEAQPGHESMKFPQQVVDAFAQLPESTKMQSYRKCVGDLRDELSR